MVAFTAGSVLTAANLNAAYNSRTLNTQVGTSYQLIAGDAGEIVTLSNASAISVVVPPNATVAYATGTTVGLINLGAGLYTYLNVTMIRKLAATDYVELRAWQSSGGTLAMNGGASGDVSNMACVWQGDG